jgi:hypothetical protein
MDRPGPGARRSHRRLEIADTLDPGRRWAVPSNTGSRRRAARPEATDGVTAFFVVGLLAH